MYLFLFSAATLLLVHLKKKISFLFQYFFVIKFYVLNIFSRSINTHTGDYGRPMADMKAAHNVLYTKKHRQTNVSYHAMDISCMTSRGLGVDLEVEGVLYTKMHRGPAAHVLGQPTSRAVYLELEGEVNVYL